MNAAHHKIICLDGESLYPVEDSIWKLFDAIAPTMVYPRTAPDQIADRIGDADMVLTNKVPVSADIMDRCKGLKYIGVLATGFNIIDTEAAGHRGITVTNIPSYSTNSVAQTAISLLLAITERVEHYAAENARGRWSDSSDFTYRDFDWHELAGKNFGVVGLGHTGSATAAIAAALGMKILVYTSKKQEDLPEGYEKTGLEDLFRRSDVLSLHCPLTSSTKDLVCADTLALMKPSAILINTSRGPVVDEHALADALNNSKIYAAGLDVLCNEPPKHDCELLAARNCFITPHLAWASVEARKRLFDIALSNVKAYIEGCPTNVIA